VTPSLLNVGNKGKRLNILLAEDSQVYEILAMKILRFYGGHHVLVAGKASEVPDLLESHEIDLAVIDLQMNGQEALAAAESVRQHDAKSGGHTQIIGISGNDLAGQEQICRQAGMDVYVPRPFVSDHLSREVRKFAESLAEA
jgi:CheY-like chemotaxis protein